MAFNNIYSSRNQTKGVVIHNDYGFGDANSYKYLSGYSDSQLANGFAHYYCDEHNIFNFWNINNDAWHTASLEGNQYYVGLEVCQSRGDEAQFLRNEQATFKMASDVLKHFGLPANRNTVRLHREFFNTACPHRSWDLHGKDTNAVKDYFISQIQKYMDGGTGESTTSTPPTQGAVMNDYPPKHQQYGFDCPRYAQGNWKDAWTVAYVEKGKRFYPNNGRYFSNANRDDVNDCGLPCQSFGFDDGAWVMDWKGQRAMTDGEDVVITHVDGVEQGYWA